MKPVYQKCEGSQQGLKFKVGDLVKVDDHLAIVLECKPNYANGTAPYGVHYYWIYYFDQDKSRRLTPESWLKKVEDEKKI